MSDGGVVTAVLEMAFPSPTAGVSVTLPAAAAGGDMAALFAEELSIVIEVSAFLPSALLTRALLPNAFLPRALLPSAFLPDPFHPVPR